MRSPPPTPAPRAHPRWSARGSDVTQLMAQRPGRARRTCSAPLPRTTAAPCTSRAWQDATVLVPRAQARRVALRARLAAFLIGVAAALLAVAIAPR